MVGRFCWFKNRSGLGRSRSRSRSGLAGRSLRSGSLAGSLGRSGLGLGSLRLGSLAGRGLLAGGSSGRGLGGSSLGRGSLAGGAGGSSSAGGGAGGFVATAGNQRQGQSGHAGDSDDLGRQFHNVILLCIWIRKDRSPNRDASECSGGRLCAAAPERFLIILTRYELSMKKRNQKSNKMHKKLNRFCNINATKMGKSRYFSGFLGRAEGLERKFYIC